MWFLDMLASVTPFILKSQKAQSGEKLAEALSAYINDPEDPGQQLRLEQLFFDAYRKRASATLIRKLAVSSRGPFEAFDIYARSGGWVGCNYETHEVRLPSGLNSWQVKLKRLSYWAMSLILGSAFLVLGIYAGFFSLKLTWSLAQTGVSDLALDDFLKTLFGIALSVMGSIFGASFLYLVTIFQLNNRYDRIVSLSAELSKQSSSVS